VASSWDKAPRASFQRPPFDVAEQFVNNGLARILVPAEQGSATSLECRGAVSSNEVMENFGKTGTWLVENVSRVPMKTQSLLSTRKLTAMVLVRQRRGEIGDRYAICLPNSVDHNLFSCFFS